jgi:hypothetical protein
MAGHFKGMAKPIELELSAVWRLKSVRALNAGQLGCFILIAHAAVFDDFDPYTAARITLIGLCRINPQSFALCYDRTFAALREALPVLRERYELVQAKRAAQRRNAPQMHPKYIERQQLRSRAKAEVKAEAQRFAGVSTCGTMLPQPKLQAYRPENNDYIARTAIRKKQQNTQKGLTDRPKTPTK